MKLVSHAEIRECPVQIKPQKCVTKHYITNYIAYMQEGTNDPGEIHTCITRS